MSEEEKDPRPENGSVVRLKSGGELMTCYRLKNEPEKIECQWHDKDGVPHNQSYYFYMVDKALSTHPYR